MRARRRKRVRGDKNTEAGQTQEQSAKDHGAAGASVKD